MLTSSLIRRGRAWKFGDNLVGDLHILPWATVQDFVNIDPAKLRSLMFSPIRLGFADMVREGDIILAGRNFAAPVTHEQVGIGLKALGIGAVLATSFGTRFLRWSIDQGICVMMIPNSSTVANEGDDLEVDPTTGTLTNHSRGEQYQGEALTGPVLEILRHGSLEAYLRARYGHLLAPRPQLAAADPAAVAAARQT